MTPPGFTVCCLTKQPPQACSLYELLGRLVGQWAHTAWWLRFCSYWSLKAKGERTNGKSNKPLDSNKTGAEMMRKPKLKPVIALQHLPCSSVRSVPPGCWEHIIFLVSSFTVPPTAFLIKSKCLSICPWDVTLALSIPAASMRWYASFAQKVPPSLRVFLAPSPPQCGWDCGSGIRPPRI